ncbi:MAG: fasciclin domain-containing protein [Solirubrobacteraceae bacterium]
MLMRRVRRHASLRLAAALLVAITAAGCSGSDDGTPERTAGARDGTAAPAPGVTGPLCDLLPAGTDPGAPASLTGEPADVALQWIPVLTTFEAALRASGLAADLRRMDGVTILAPTDDAFMATFSRETLDELLLSRRRELRALLEAHMIDGARSLAELRDAGSVTTLSGNDFTVTPAATMARFDGRAETVCADYEVSNARIHVVDGVLGALPEPAPEAG